MKPIRLNKFGEELTIDDSVIMATGIDDEHSLGIPYGGKAIVVGNIWVIGFVLLLFPKPIMFCIATITV